MTVNIVTNFGKVEVKARFPISAVMKQKIRLAIEETQKEKPEFADAGELVKKLKEKDPVIGTPRGALLAYMNSRGWTQQALSVKAGISQPDISKMIGGKRPIGLQAAKKLGKAFGVDYRKFV